MTILNRVVNSFSILFSNSSKRGQRFLYFTQKNQFSVPAAEGNVSKEALMQLRKKTGYSISKCKQAIQKFGDNLQEAEQWLQQTAREEGWDKINKRANVSTDQGLLGMITANGLAAIVEVNCQTDFVARNEKFRTLVSQISRGIFNDAARNYRLQNDELSTKWNLPFDRLSEKQLDFGVTLPDLLADTAGHLGEKITVGGACIMRVPTDVTLTGYMHPRADTINGVPTGRFAALVALRAGRTVPEETRTQLGYQLCQHIIGMNPKEIGLPPGPESASTETTASAQKGENLESVRSAGESDTDVNKLHDELEEKESESHAQMVTKLSNETTLLRQDFMLEPDITVYEFLRQNDAMVIDFVRIERGGISNLVEKKD